MTKENSKRLYEHYIKIGYVRAVDDMLIKYPDFKEIVKAVSNSEPKKVSK